VLTGQLELNRFNLEIMSDPVPIAGRPFSAIGKQVDRELRAVGAAAANHGGRIAMIGILPTLRAEDLRSEALTTTARYRALSAGIRRMRREPFEIHIAGDDVIDITTDDVTMEGASTSWQIHLKVPPRDFAATYNAAQLATAPVLAAAVNSPMFLGRRLWDETRIALFRQSVDERPEAAADDWRPARVSFGTGWLRSGALELFEECVRLHLPLLAEVDSEDPMAVLDRGATPQLRELRLHSGTVWRWNRAVFDPTDGGHVRMELRALPAGPTVLDMTASTAFLVGLTLGLAPEMSRRASAITFGQARRNFYEAARRGLEAELLWPSETRPSPRPYRAADLIPGLLRVAERGLGQVGVEPGEITRLLGVVADRVGGRCPGAAWQRQTLAALEAGASRDDALVGMVQRYVDHSAGGEAVHTWPTP
jgi:hypothetical protein